MAARNNKAKSSILLKELTNKTQKGNITMKNLKEFLITAKAPIKMQYGQINIDCTQKRWNENIIFFRGKLLCNPIHIQPLLDLGVHVSFQSKNKDFAWNQNHVGSGLNTCSFDVRMDLKVYELVNNFFRKEGSLDVLNNSHLMTLGFPFSKKVIARYNLKKI